MKKIECCVHESEVQPLLSALIKTGIGGVTVYAVRANMNQVEVVALDIEADCVIGTFLEVTRKKRIGNAPVTISSIEEVVRIRTGEKGAKAVF